MKHFFLIAWFFAISFVSAAQHYLVSLDLIHVTDDKVPVEIIFMNFNLPETIEFQMPKIVPGTYAISDFGRALTGFKAYDVDGNELEVDRIDVNRWLITPANKLATVKYLVDDTFDSKEMRDIFEPGGTNIQKDVNFVINTFGFIGYLKGNSEYPIEIRVLHPENLYGASPMFREHVSDDEEIFFADNYFQMTDSPIMYSIPDTASVMIGNTRVMVSVYSPGNKTNAQLVMKQVEPTLKGAGEFLGGELPVNNYLIMIYLTDFHTASGGYGALEHSYSTVFVLPDTKSDYLSETIVDITAHEFFHIITPLTIHSEEIGNYDFINPKMSKHLWLYEGVTEYTSMRMQVMYGLVTPGEFLEVINDKLANASDYTDDLPFTEMSLGALDKYEDEYDNVYEKGALIGMCLDLKLLELSDGKMGVREVLNKLSEEYGIEHSFKDEELFDAFTKLTYPEIREFFVRYVEGPEPLPFAECLGYAGVVYHAPEMISMNTLGNIDMVIEDGSDLIVVDNTEGMDDFGKKMGFREGDALVSINGKKMDIDNYEEVFDYFQSLNKADKITVVVLRKNKKGQVKEKKLKGRVTKVKDESYGYAVWSQNPTKRQLMIRNIWLNISK